MLEPMNTAQRVFYPLLYAAQQASTILAPFLAPFLAKDPNNHRQFGTFKSRRAKRYVSGYCPRMSGTGERYDRLSHRLGRP